MFLFLSLALAVLVISLTCRAVADTAVVRDPEIVIAELKNGNLRFVNNEPREIGEAAVLRRMVEQKGYEPIAAVIACSDARIPVEDIFSQPPGRLYVINVAGNTAGIQSIGTVEYGLTHYRIPVVVVLGHTHCGSIKAVVSGKREEGCLDRMLDPIRQAGALLERPVASYRDPVQAWTIANVRYAAESFLKTNPLFARKVQKRQVRLLEAVYDNETGAVTWLDES